VEIVFLTLARLLGPITLYCPPPSQGAGGGRVSGRVVGVFYENRSRRDARDRGRGVPPPPRQPLPTGAILP